MYVAEMRQLETQQPDAYKQFKVEPLWSVDHPSASSTVFPLTRLWNRQSTVRPKAMEVSLALHCEKER